ncbi:type IV secretion system protein TraC, partial [Moraxella catarrhalis]
ICELYHTITFFAPRNKLNQYEQVINNIWESMGFKLCSLETLQMSAFYSALPMTLNADLRSDLKRFQLISTKTTLNAVDMSPIIGEWTGLGDKVLCFFGRKGNPVFLDLYANTAGNYNLFVTGASGSGKSVLLGELINAYRGVGAKAYVIDNGRSFRNIVERQGGVFLDFDSKSNICINPFSWISGSERWENELEMLVPIYARMAAPNSSLSDYQKALLREALTITYTTYGSQGGVDEVIEVLGSMMNELGAPDAEAFRLAKQLSPYSSKAHGAYGKFFNGQANLRLDGDMVGLELEELNNFKDLRKVIVLTLIMRVTAQMYLSRKQKKVMIIDEAWDLLGNDEDAAKFIEEGYRRVRKYGGIFCVGTQGIQDAVMNKAAGAAFSNADWKFFLRPDMDKLQEVIKDSLIALDDTKIKYLESLQTEQGKYSEVLITSPNGMNIVRHIADPYSLLLSASNQADYNEVEELRNEGYNATEVLNIMAQRRGMEII